MVLVSHLLSHLLCGTSQPLLHSFLGGRVPKIRCHKGTANEHKPADSNALHVFCGAATIIIMRLMIIIIMIILMITIIVIIVMLIAIKSMIIIIIIVRPEAAEPAPCGATASAAAGGRWPRALDYNI